METKRKFSEVSHVFNTHAANLNRAREFFEKETRQLNEFILEHLDAVIERPPEDPVRLAKVRWADPRDWSVTKEVAWLNFSTGSQLRMDVLQPGFKKFKLSAGALYFTIEFDEENERFMFMATFENSNNVDESIDEKLMQLVIAAGAERFPNAYAIKANTVVLCRRELSDDLFDHLNQYVEDAIRITEQAVDLVFPDTRYAELSGLRA